MVRRALFLVIFVVVAAALVAGYGGGEQRPEGGAARTKLAGRPAALRVVGRVGLRVRRILGRDRQLGRLKLLAGVGRGTPQALCGDIGPLAPCPVWRRHVGRCETSRTMLERKRRKGGPIASTTALGFH